MSSIRYEVAKRIIYEQRYQSLKGNRGFISRFSQSGSAHRSLRSYIISNYAASVFAFSLLSLALSFIKLYGDNVNNLLTLEVLLFFYVLSANVFNSVLFLDSIVTENLLQPVSVVPIKKPALIIPLSYMLYYGSSSVFVIVPFLFLSYTLIHSYLFVATGLIWMIVYIILGYLIGCALFSFLYKVKNPRRPSALKNVATILRLLVIVAVFSFFEIWIYDPQVLPSFITAPVHGIILSLVPVLNVTALLETGKLNVFMELVPFAVYSIIIMISYFIMGSSTYEKLKTPRENFSDSSFSTSGKMHRPMLTMVEKNIRLIFRKSQYSLMIFFPVMIAIPFAVPLILSGQGSNFDPLGLYYTMLTIPVICASIYSLVSYISEGTAIPLLFTIPGLERRDVESKSISGILVFSLIVIPLTVFIMETGKYSFIDYVLIITNLITGFSFAYMIIMRRLQKKINPYVTVVNLDTFGGSIGLLLSFGFVLAIILIPVISGAVISIYILSGSSVTTLILDLSLNIFILFITIFSLFILRTRKNYGERVTT